jgi:hypothetical protein
MTRHLHDRSRFLLATGLAALLLGAVGYGAMPQTKKAPKSSAAAPGDLQQQMTALQRQLQQLEDHLALLEQARRAGDAAANKVATEDKTMTVKAPFTVVDANNKPIMRVQDADAALGRGIYVFQSGSTLPMAHLGVLKTGAGRVYVANAGSTRPEAQMVVLAKGGVIETYAAGGSHRLLLLDHQGVSVVNGKDVIVGNIGVLDERGALELNDATGGKMVTAGSLSNGKGMVQANPSHVQVSIDGNPSVLLGGKK